MEQKNKSSGFASMDALKQREIARKGGMAAHRKGTAHEFTSDEARNAGRKGGQQVSANRSHMKEIGRLGGKRSAERRRSKGSAATNRPSETVPVEAEIEAPEEVEEMAEASVGGAPLDAEHEQTEHMHEVLP